MEPFIGEIRMVGFTYAPKGWAFCDGQIMSIASNTALFSLLGTTYGGNGVNTFALPDLRGRYAMHPGSGPGLSPRVLGESGGVEKVALVTNEMPAHNHLVSCRAEVGSQTSPSAHFPAGNQVNRDTGVPADTSYEATSDSTMHPGVVQAAGGGQPHDNMPPFACVNFIIATEGIFPPRP